jgi:hypothetical protein
MQSFSAEQCPLPGLPAPAVRCSEQAEQLVLIGEPKPLRVPAQQWSSWLGDLSVVARFEVKRYRRHRHQCWPWLGAVSSTGHGSFRAGSLPGRSRRGTVPAHLFAYQMTHGVIVRLGWTNTDDAVLAHRCDNAGCTNPQHMQLGTNATNRSEYVERRHRPDGPLADLRGAAGRTRAIARSVRIGLSSGATTEEIENLIQTAELAGLPLTLM